MDSESRGVLLSIAVVLIISIASLGVVLYFSWSFFSKPFLSISKIVTGVYQNKTYNYNFPISLVDAKASDENAIVEDTKNNVNKEEDNKVSLSVNYTDAVLDFNFRPPKYNFDPAQIGIQSEILQDAIRAGYSTEEFGSLPKIQSQLKINIPKIGIDSPIWQGNDANNYLEKGFWAYPFSGALGKGENVFLCHRRFFGPNDPRSCWFLDKLEKNDLINIYVAEEVEMVYQIIDIKIFSDQDPNIYNIDLDKDLIRIVTCNPLYSNSERLVVIAERIK